MPMEASGHSLARPVAVPPLLPLRDATRRPAETGVGIHLDGRPLHLHRAMRVVHDDLLAGCDSGREAVTSFDSPTAVDQSPVFCGEYGALVNAG